MNPTSHTTLQLRRFIAAEKGHNPQWLAYVIVPNCDASAAHVEKLGGKICMPAKDIPTVGRIAIFTDPEGAPLGLFQPLGN
jgi:uncharacterized protein